MKANVKEFLSKLNEGVKLDNVSWDSVGNPQSDIRWTQSADDQNFFNACVEKMQHRDVQSVLDIACGFGNFVSTCNNNGIAAFGVDPLPPSKDNFYVGTFATVVENSELLGDYKFDCITTHNTLHGKYHNQEELKKLFDFFKKHAKYVIITEPRENSSELLSGLKLEHAFASSHRSTFHKLYKVEG